MATEIETSNSDTNNDEMSDLDSDSASDVPKKKDNRLSPSEDKVKNTIFVGNLPNGIGRNALKKLFAKFGPILHSRLRCAIRKELNTTKKLAVIKKTFHEDSNHINAFIKFKTVESCKEALKMNGKLYKGHHLRVTLAEDVKKFDSKKSIFIGNLAFKIQDDDVWKAFEDCGAIESVRLVRDNKTGIGKGFGYVNFKSADSVELALGLNGMSILDRDVRVSRAATDAKNTSMSAKRQIEKKFMPSWKPSKMEDTKKNSKPLTKVKGKNDFQGQKTKPSMQKKFKKRKKIDKRKMTIKHIAEGLSAKK